MKRLLAASLIASVAGSVFADENHDLASVPTPTESQGVSLDVLQQFDLAPQIAAMSGYDIRMRKITFAPGATFAQHSHAIRPGLVYVLEGEILDVRGDDRRVYKAGEHWMEDASTDHWLANISDEPVTFIMIDTPIQE